MNADLVFAAEYFDFQPACLSQFKYESNVYWHSGKQAGFEIAS